MRYSPLGEEQVTSLRASAWEAKLERKRALFKNIKLRSRIFFSRRITDAAYYRIYFWTKPNSSNSCKRRTSEERTVHNPRRCPSTSWTRRCLPWQPAERLLQTDNGQRWTWHWQHEAKSSRLFAFGCLSVSLLKKCFFFIFRLYIRVLKGKQFRVLLMSIWINRVLKSERILLLNPPVATWIWRMRAYV